MQGCRDEKVSINSGRWIDYQWIRLDLHNCEPVRALDCPNPIGRSRFKTTPKLLLRRIRIERPVSIERRGILPPNPDRPRMDRRLSTHLLPQTMDSHGTDESRRRRHGLQPICSPAAKNIGPRDDTRRYEYGELFRIILTTDYLGREALDAKLRIHEVVATPA
jgi:hypothetical protein